MRVVARHTFGDYLACLNVSSSKEWKNRQAVVDRRVPYAPPLEHAETIRPQIVDKYHRANPFVKIIFEALVLLRHLPTSLSRYLFCPESWP